MVNMLPAGTMETIEEVAKRALKAAEDELRAGRRFGAVNWSDLRVADVAHCETLRNGSYIAVEIEEASPDCDLPTFVYEQLKANFPAIQFVVRTEW